MSDRFKIPRKPINQCWQCNGFKFISQMPISMGQHWALSELAPAEKPPIINIPCPRCNYNQLTPTNAEQGESNDTED